MATATRYWPHKMEKGIFRGRTFQSQNDYSNALRDMKRRANGKQPQHSLDAELVLRICDAYDLCMESGMGRTRASEMVATLIR